MCLEFDHPWYVQWKHSELSVWQGRAPCLSPNASASLDLIIYLIASINVYVCAQVIVCILVCVFVHAEARGLSLCSPPYFFLKIYSIFNCMCVFLCVEMCTCKCRCQRRSDAGLGYSELELQELWAIHCGHWEPNSGLLGEHQVLLTTQVSSQLLLPSL